MDPRPQRPARELPWQFHNEKLPTSANLLRLRHLNQICNLLRLRLPGERPGRRTGRLT